jgi:octaprenyl-diphosphate synthase
LRLAAASLFVRPGISGVFAVGVVLNIEDGKREAPSIRRLLELTAADMGRVNELILAKAGSDVEMIPEVANHLISSGGKRLRPMVTLAAAQMFGYSGDGHVKLATSVEFMHTATLLHDDVVDESDLRRGKKTARMIWGNQASVLVGDFLLGQAFRMMVDVGSLDALDILSTAASIIAEGEVMQLAAAKNLETTEDEHFAVIKAKTAALFSAAAEVGPVIAKATRNDRAALRSYGMNLGLAFQLIDDALDYGGSAKELGKNIGDDFREGKVTLPVILAYRRGTEIEREFWRRTLEKQEQKDGDLEHAIALLHRHRAIEDTIERARHYGAIARDALGIFPDQAAKTALLEAIDFTIERAF